MEIEDDRRGSGGDGRGQKRKKKEQEDANDEDAEDDGVASMIEEIVANAQADNEADMENEKDLDKLGILLILTDATHEHHKALVRTIVAAYKAADEAQKEAAKKPNADEELDATALKKNAPTVGSARNGTNWRISFGGYMKSGDAITWSEFDRRWAGMKALMKSFHPSNDESNPFMNRKEDVMALAELMGLRIVTYNNVSIECARRYKTWEDFKGGVDKGILITQAEIDRTRAEWSEGLSASADTNIKGYIAPLLELLRWEGVFGNVNKQMHDREEGGYVFMDNGEDCLVVRDDCVSNLSHLTKDDVPSVSDNEEWRRFEMSDRYYELCDKAKKVSSEMDLLELKALEETEESDAIQEIIDSINEF